MLKNFTQLHLNLLFADSIIKDIIGLSIMLIKTLIFHITKCGDGKVFIKHLPIIILLNKKIRLLFMNLIIIENLFHLC